MMLRLPSGIINVCNPWTTAERGGGGARTSLRRSVLGVRMAMLGCRMLGIEDPRGLATRVDRKRLVTFVEIDRCATRRDRGGDGLPIGQAGAEVSRLGQDGG